MQPLLNRRATTSSCFVCLNLSTELAIFAPILKVKVQAPVKQSYPIKLFTHVDIVAFRPNIQPIIMTRNYLSYLDGH
jgi:hypothetical protein